MPYAPRNLTSGGSRNSQARVPIAKVGGEVPTYYLNIFSEYCMKMKKFWAGKGCVPWATRSANADILPHHGHVYIFKASLVI